MVLILLHRLRLSNTSRLKLIHFIYSADFSESKYNLSNAYALSLFEVVYILMKMLWLRSEMCDLVLLNFVFAADVMQQVWAGNCTVGAFLVV